MLGEQIELELRLANRLPGIEANVGALEQAVMQLAINARDAMPDGGRLTIETRVDPRREIVLSFSDSGAGMDDETRRRALEPFFTTKTGTDSVGLGLTTVNALVERLGGQLELKSAPGMGTVVRAFLPAAEFPANPVSGRRPPGPGTVLMVEDEETLRTVVDRILTDEGYRVITAASGEEAMELSDAEPGPIDLLVSDVVLGGMTGPELAAQLKARRPGLKTLLMSGYAGMPIGPVDDFLAKPFSPFELARRNPPHPAAVTPSFQRLVDAPAELVDGVGLAQQLDLGLVEPAAREPAVGVAGGVDDLQRRPALGHDLDQFRARSSPASRRR